ncbi:MAG: hypothetical protein Q4P23_02435, partial [Micrococcaceae bacterium]|nr:hypothetical protein [Micrococcaceae bacterium]
WVPQTPKQAHVSRKSLGALKGQIEVWVWVWVSTYTAMASGSVANFSAVIEKIAEAGRGIEVFMASTNQLNPADLAVTIDFIRDCLTKMRLRVRLLGHGMIPQGGRRFPGLYDRLLARILFPQ